MLGDLCTLFVNLPYILCCENFKICEFRGPFPGTELHNGALKRSIHSRIRGMVVSRRKTVQCLKIPPLIQFQSNKCDLFDGYLRGAFMLAQCGDIVIHWTENISLMMPREMTTKVIPDISQQC